MKNETWIMVVTILLLFMFGFAMSQQTTINKQKATDQIQIRRMSVLQNEIRRLENEQQPKQFVYPVLPSWISSAFGYRTDPMGGGPDERLHRGVDLLSFEGAPIRAILPGVISEHWPAPNEYYQGHPILGGMVVIDHGGFYSLYGHMSETFVHEGDKVQAGQIIGTIGDTGEVTGPHLHFEIIVDPFTYLEEMR